MNSKSLNHNDEEEMRIILEPLVDNGRSLHNEIISQIDLYDPEYELTQEDIDEIQNLDDEQLAQLSFVMSTTYSNVANSDCPDPTVRACLAVAVGIQGFMIVSLRLYFKKKQEVTLSRLPPVQ